MEHLQTLKDPIGSFFQLMIGRCREMKAYLKQHNQLLQFDQCCMVRFSGPRQTGLTTAMVALSSERTIYVQRVLDHFKVPVFRDYKGKKLSVGSLRKNLDGMAPPDLLILDPAFFLSEHEQREVIDLCTRWTSDPDFVLLMVG